MWSPYGELLDRITPFLKYFKPTVKMIEDCSTKMFVWIISSDESITLTTYSYCHGNILSIKFTIKISYFTKRLFLFRWIAIHMAIFLLPVFIHRIARLLVLYFFSTIATCTCPHNALPERSTNFKFIPVFIYSKIVMHKSLQMFINFLRSVNNLLHNLLSLFPCIAYLRTKYAKHSIEIVDLWTTYTP